MHNAYLVICLTLATSGADADRRSAAEVDNVECYYSIISQIIILIGINVLINML